MTTATDLSVNSDFYVLDDYLNDTDRALIARVRSFVEQDVTPIINEYWEKADFPYQLVPKFAGAGNHRHRDPGLRLPGPDPAADRPRRDGTLPR